MPLVSVDRGDVGANPPAPVWDASTRQPFDKLRTGYSA
jgi:hypothetical protein